MFFFDDLFDYDPLEDYLAYRARQQRREQRRQYRSRNPYYDTIEDRLNQVLREEFGIDPYHHIDINRRAQQLQEQKDADAQDHSALKERIENEAREDRAIDNSQQTQTETQQKQEEEQYRRHSPYQSYFYSSNSSYDGRKYVEEHREKVTESDGKVHQTTRRRLGDRWYEIESTTDADGKATSKETWHNVPENEIEHFKAEWAQQHEDKYAIKHEPKNEPQSEPQNEQQNDPQNEQKQEQ